MALQSLMRDKITVLKADGQVFDNLDASVHDKEIILMTSSVLISPNDLIQRTMSNGGEETFRVLDPGFRERLYAIPAHYQMKVEKLGLPEAKKAVHSITYNISGTNNRVNNNSVDNSTNIVNINPDVADQLSKLRAEIEKTLPQEQKTEALELADAIEEQFSSGKPSKVILKGLIAALPAAANIATIGAFILTLL